MLYAPFLAVFAVLDLGKYRDALREVNELRIGALSIVAYKVVPLRRQFAHIAPCEGERILRLDEIDRELSASFAIEKHHARPLELERILDNLDGVLLVVESE